MQAPDLFKNLALDAWYKAFVYLGGVVFVLSLIFDFKGITNGQAQLLFLGIFFIGIGEWKNHKTASWIKPSNAYTGGPALMSANVRQPDGLGIAFDFLGAALVLLGMISILVRQMRS